MTSREETAKEVQRILVEQLQVNPEEVIPTARFGEDLNADSLDLVEATIQLEEVFGIEIPENEMETIKTVGQIIDLICSKVDA